MDQYFFTAWGNEQRLYLPTWAGISFLAWSTLYGCLCQVNPSRSREWNCRLVTALHGVVSFAVASWSAFISGPFPLRHDVVGGPNDRLHEVAMLICFGYFLFDFIWCMSMQTEGAVMLLHHMVCIVGLTASLAWGFSGAEVIATIVGSEITNPLLQARWFMKQTSTYDSRLGRLVDFMFVLLFICIRIGVGAILFYVAVSSPNVTLFFKIGGVSLYLISVIFLCQILQFAHYKLFGVKRQSSKDKALRSSNPDNSNHLQNGTSRLSQNGSAKSNANDLSKVKSS